MRGEIESSQVEGALRRLSAALDDGDDEVALLAATTLRTLIALADRDRTIAPARLDALRARATGLLERAPRRLHGAGSIFRLLDKVKRAAKP